MFEAWFLAGVSDIELEEDQRGLETRVLGYRWNVVAI
jgi:hypothetical protein